MASEGTFGSLWTGPRDNPRRYRVDLSDEGLVSVGNGGEGLVYRAIRTVDGVTTDVALKLLTGLILDDYERVAERASILASIEHQHVMRQIETFVGTALINQVEVQDDEFDVLYTVAEWVPGRPLADAVAEAGTNAGLHWVNQIAQGVSCLHSHQSSSAPNGIVHRDIKPSNVRITPERQAVLIDFGIARPQSTSDLTDGVGTYLWRAPEVVGGPGKAGPASDNWGVGALAYWVLVGEPPRLEGAEVARERVLHAAREGGCPDPVGLSRHVASLLETHPDDRPQDLTRWADDLEASARGSLRRRRWVRSGIAVATSALVVIGIGTWVGISQFTDKSRSSSSPTVLNANGTTVGYKETSGGTVHTWTDFTDAGGASGPSIRAGETVLVKCRVIGFKVTDGNTWWYQIESSPWDGNYFGSADAFYNNVKRPSSFLDTPFVDPSVPVC